MRYLSLMMLAWLLAGCTGGGMPPVSDRSRVTNTTAHAADYRVVAGDTLYSIAWRHQRDFRELAALNHINPPYDIYPGQRLQVTGRANKPAPAVKSQASTRRSVPATRPVTRPGTAARQKPHPLAQTQTKPQSGAKPRRPSQPVTTRPAPVKRIPAAATPATPATPARGATTAPRTGPVQLRWPGKGKRLVGFGQPRTGSPLPSNSIDFELAPGASIRAAAAGQVVYVGQALAGFQQFVIVKHNDTWLSAYGFNAPANVQEKQRLASGAVLAVVGRGGSARERELHFEVRKNGSPVNPAGVIR